MICNRGTNNRASLTKLSYNKENLWIEINGNKIYAVYDVPHFIKSIRNNLLTSG